MTQARFSLEEGTPSGKVKHIRTTPAPNGAADRTTGTRFCRPGSGGFAPLEKPKAKPNARKAKKR